MAQRLCLGSVCSLGKRLRWVTWQPCVILHSCQQQPRVLMRPYPYQHVPGVPSKVLATRASGACEERASSPGQWCRGGPCRGPCSGGPRRARPSRCTGQGRAGGLARPQGPAPPPQPLLLPPLRASVVTSCPSAKFTSFFPGEQVLSGPEILMWPSCVITLGGTDLLFHGSVQSSCLTERGQLESLYLLV